MCIVCLWGWYKYFTTAHLVVVDPNGSIIFKNILGTTVIPLRDIISIKETILFVEIEHNHGRVLVSTLMDRVGEFKSLLLSLNQDIKTKYAYYRGIKWK
jgi:hypothetical protein